MLPRSLVRPGTPSAAGLLLVLTLAGGVATASPASAHEELVSTSPNGGARLATAPAALRLEFSDRIDPRMTTVTVSGPGGVLRTPPSQTAGTFVLQPLPPLTTGGTHVAAYRVVSADGHPVTGAFRFTVARGAARTAVTRQASDDVAPARFATVAADRSDARTSGPLPLLGMIGALLTALTPAVALVNRRRRGPGGPA